LAASTPINITATGEIYCAGQGDDIQWRLEPQIGTLEVGFGSKQATYTPPCTIPNTTQVRVIADYPGQNKQRKQAETNLEVQKP
jgi:hypothetical protein